MHEAFVVAQGLRRDSTIEIVRIGDAALENLIEALERGRRRRRREPRAHRLAAAARDVEHIVRRGLGSLPLGIHRRAVARGDEGMECVLDVGRPIGLIPEPLCVGFVLGKEQLRLALAGQRVFGEIHMRRFDDARPHTGERGLPIVQTPRPGVAKPDRRQQMQPCRLRASIVRGDPDEQVIGFRLGVFHEHIEVPVVVENAGIEQLVLEVLARAPLVGLDEVSIGILALGVFVQILHVGVRRRAVDVEVVLLDVLAVIAFAVGEAEQPLLENRIALVPEGEREAELLLVVADTAESVLAPAIRA